MGLSGSSAGAFRQPLHKRPVASDQRVLLGPAPALDASFRVDRIRDVAELLREHERHRPPCARIAGILCALVFTDALVERIAARPSDIVAAVGTAQDIDESAHRSNRSPTTLQPSPSGPHLNSHMSPGSRSNPLMLRCEPSEPRSTHNAGASFEAQ